MKKMLSGNRLHNLIDSRSLIRIVRRGIATSVATALLNVITMAAVSSPRSESSMGNINVLGTVKIDGQSALSGQTLFSGSSIVTSANSESLIEYENFGRLKLAAETELLIDSSKQRISGSLQKGEVLGSLPAGVSLDFKTSDFSMATDASERVIFTIQTKECDGTNLSVREGTVNVRAGDKVRTVKAGENFSTFADGAATQGAQNNFSHRKRVGLIIGIGAAIGVVLAVVLGNRNQQTTGGGCVVVPSGSGGSGQCS
ncbi:MAG TPA: hypothetical protein VFQ43_05770 [Nitrososphaera sp.]|nr:hypothetical protein [Nitrososphaera sp.]